MQLAMFVLIANGRLREAEAMAVEAALEAPGVEDSTSTFRSLALAAEAVALHHIRPQEAHRRLTEKLNGVPWTRFPAGTRAAIQTRMSDHGPSIAGTPRPSERL